MRTKFDAILLNIRQKIAQCEREATLIYHQIQQTQQQIFSCTQSIAQMQMPLSGSTLAFRELYDGKKALIQEIDELNLYLSSLKAQLRDKEEERKEVELEFEKIKYLQQKEIAQMLKNFKRKEQQELDEIAVMLFAKQGGEK
ncbi:flagellar export protein FliJ [Helicobacter cholecystus]|uniref:flagellar export protein FliJ n=1 Tax=Helicobacter cholecystus TaxID=45498 RepID=UPI0027395BEC|nr:flagellar export protein FliJ [Helicobacter cholecystus]